MRRCWVNPPTHNHSTNNQPVMGRIPAGSSFPPRLGHTNVARMTKFNTRPNEIAPTRAEKLPRSQLAANPGHKQRRSDERMEPWASFPGIIDITGAVVTCVTEFYPSSQFASKMSWGRTCDRFASLMLVFPANPQSRKCQRRPGYPRYLAASSHLRLVNPREIIASQRNHSPTRSSACSSFFRF